MFHANIYRNKREKFARFKSFFTYEIPYAVWQGHRQLFYAFCFFMLAVIIGVVSSIYDDHFIRLIMGDSYVNMTLANIEKGDPMAVYKSMSPGSMFVGIAINNIFVAFRAFVYGIFFSIGTVYALVQNGLMVGAFVTMFAQKGLLKLALLSIFLHGALELSAIVIAGGAGIVLGNSILFPGTYPRMYSLRRAARQALKIAVGLVPVFILAALFESFVTPRYQELRVFLSLLIIISSFTFIGVYYIYFPLHLQKKFGWKK
jgi:uncharacterized membrane protein SpoIIM required for sporulation